MKNNFFVSSLFERIERVNEIPLKKYHMRKICEYILKYPEKGYSLYKFNFPIFKINQRIKNENEKIQKIYQIKYKDQAVYTPTGCLFSNHFNRELNIFTRYKNITNTLLKDLGFKSVSFKTFCSLKDIKKYYIKYDFIKKLVAKPVDGKGGENVYLNIDSLNELIKCSKEILSNSPVVQIELDLSYFNDFRIYCLGGKFYGAVQRIKAFIIGDGRSSVRELTLKKNKKKKYKPIVIDSITRDLLKEQSVNLKTILPRSKKIYLKRVNNFSQGGEVVDVSKKINSIIIFQCEKICNYLQMPILGFDILTNDISLPLEKTKGVILEVNNAPQWDVIFKIKGFQMVEDLLSSLFNE